MSNEEYLRACGWTLIREGDTHSVAVWQKGPDPVLHQRYQPDALKAQLAEDRARLTFVLDRSALTIMRGLEHYEVHIAPKDTA